MLAKRNIVYLYSEVMPYTIAVMRAIVDNFGVIIHCICWDENKRTPFVPEDTEGVFFYKRSSFDKDKLREFIDEKSPEFIYASGRMDELYLQTVLYYRHKGITTVTGCDNQWTGSRKNKIASWLAYFLYRRYFMYMWVAGTPQYEFARRMGYAAGNILKDTYSADTDKFEKAFHNYREIKAKEYPHTLVFVGRFIKIKGIELLLQAFSEVKAAQGGDWKLCLVGSGDLSVDLKGRKDIEVRQFMSTDELASSSKDWGCFCLPSTREPWGVVVHEFAAAGLPIIAADCVGATDAFLIDGYNGFSFATSSVQSLKKSLSALFTLSDDELRKLSSRSNELSHTITPVKSAYSLMSITNLTTI